MFLRAVAGMLFVVWLAQILRGKSGFVHILLLSAIGVAVVEIVSIYRRRMDE